MSSLPPLFEDDRCTCIAELETELAYVEQHLRIILQSRQELEAEKRAALEQLQRDTHRHRLQLLALIGRSIGEIDPKRPC